MKVLRAFGAVALLLLPTRLTRRMEDPSPAPPQPLTVLSGRIERNATLATLLGRTLSPAGVQRLVEAARPVYDLARLSVGHPFGVALGPDGLVAAFTYGIDELRTLRVTRRGEELRAEVLTGRSETRTVAVQGVIRTSLFAAVTDAGEEDQLALDLADVFAWDVDFSTEIQKGDSFRAAVEKLYVEGRFTRYGRIVAAEFVRGPRVLRAVRFQGSRGPGYYTPDGTPLRKAFLRSPLRFTRVSSGFTHARFHPILQEVTAHLGIDYAAPAGTPVTASADGRVTLAGWTPGFGKTIRLHHANGFDTYYGHLSRIDVRGGQRVAQGATIGAVGSTGLSTGPHLDYRMTRNGAFVNPLALQSPPAEPIPDDDRAAFREARDAALALLGQGSPRTAAAGAALGGSRFRLRQ